MERFLSFLGLFVFIAIAFALSNNRKAVNLKLVAVGLALQIFLALLVLGVPSLGFNGPLYFLFDWANTIVIELLGFTAKGSQFIFGSLLDVKENGFIFAFQVLPTIIFFASVMTVLYYLGIIQRVVQTIAIIMQKAMGVSGAESLSVAANIFVGQTEAPLVIRPYVKDMTQSELMAVMTGGMATVAGGVMAAYVGMLQSRIPDIAGHLLTASVMSAPAALVIAKIMFPETETPKTLGQVPKHLEEVKDQNVIEAAARGAGDGLVLALNVGAMLLAFVALIAMLDAMLAQIGLWLGYEHLVSYLQQLSINNQLPEALVPTSTELSFSGLLGVGFVPIAFFMGIPAHEVFQAGSLLGQKIVLNEFVAYLNLSNLADSLSDRSVVILSYALCGFANFSSIAIQIGGIGGIAPTRRGDLARLGIRSVIAGSMAAFMTACLAGILI